MEFLRKITDFIRDLDDRDFYKYLGIILFVVLLIISFMVYRYYSQVSKYAQEIETINDRRSDEVRKLLTRMESAQKQKKDAYEMLKKNTDFNIKGYFDKILEDLNLSKYKKEEGTVTEKAVDEYNEVEFPIELNELDMSQLCLILKELEATPRIKINYIDIKRSQNKSDAIDVSLVISTYLVKTETA